MSRFHTANDRELFYKLKGVLKKTTLHRQTVMNLATEHSNWAYENLNRNATENEYNRSASSWLLKETGLVFGDPDRINLWDNDEYIIVDEHRVTFGLMRYL